MFMLLTDETNTKQTDAVKFFTYGGLMVKLEYAPILHTRIEDIRTEYGYRACDVLKFETRSRPSHVTLEQATAAKQQVVKACIDAGCKFIAYVVHHEIAKGKDIKTVIEWGASHVIGKFNYFLKLEDTYGIVAMDRLPNNTEFGYLSSKFTEGLTFSDDDPVSLDRIIMFSSTCINASHLSSAMDIVLGSWRYCINSPHNQNAAHEMMTDLAKVIWCRREGDTLHVEEKGLVMRPKDIRWKQYKDDYRDLINRMNDLLAGK